MRLRVRNLRTRSPTAASMVVNLSQQNIHLALANARYSILLRSSETVCAQKLSADTFDSVILNGEYTRFGI